MKTQRKTRRRTKGICFQLVPRLRMNQIPVEAITGDLDERESIAKMLRKAGYELAARRFDWEPRTSIEVWKRQRKHKEA